MIVRGPSRERLGVPRVAAILCVLMAAGEARGAFPFTYERGIQAPVPTAGERFGAVLVRVGTGNTVLVGTQPGPTTQAKVYRVNILTGAASNPAYLSPTVGGGDLFGAAMAVAGSSVFIGSPGWNGGRGAVHEFDLTTAAFIRSFANDTFTPNAAQFGTSVAVMGQFLLVGAPLADSSLGPSQVGQVFVFDLAGTNPLEPVRVCDGLPVVGSEFGRTLAPVGAQLAVGAPGYIMGSNYGLVYFIDPLAEPFTDPCPLLWNRGVSIPGARFGEAVENVAGLIVGGAPGVAGWSGNAEVIAYDSNGVQQYAGDVSSGGTAWGYGRSLGAMGSNLLVGMPTFPSPGFLLYSDVGGFFDQNYLPYFPDSEYGYALEAFNNRVVVGSPGIANGEGMIHVLQWACGDGTVDDLGEGCDDGNVLSGDCCSSTCQKDGDGTPCGSTDMCAAGMCSNGACEASCMLNVQCYPLCGDFTCQIDQVTGACGCLPTPTTTSTSSTSTTSTSTTTTTSTSTTTTTSTSTSTTLPPNTPPVAVLPAAVTIVTGEAFVLDGTASFDADGDPLTYNWTVNPSTGATLDSSTSPTPVLTPTVAQDYTIELVVNDGSDTSVPATLIVTAEDSSPISLTIDSPAAEETVPLTTTIVSGTVDAGGSEFEVGVAVNGVPAVSFATAYAAVDVPLLSGANVITATATTVAGKMRSVSHIVMSAGNAPLLKVLPTPNAGIAPLTVTFEYVLGGGAGVAQVTLDADGDGVIDLGPLGPSAVVTWQYPAPGLYEPVLTVSDNAAGVYTAEDRIAVSDANALDAQLRALWLTVVGKLIDDDEAGVVALMTGPGQEAYGEMLGALAGNLSPIGNALGPAEPVALGGQVAVYVFDRGSDSFLVTFVRDADGVWRVESF